MGWCSGDALLGESWAEIREYVEPEYRADLFALLIDLFEDHDMDCYDSIEDFEEGKEALHKLHPDWYDEDD